MRPFRTSGFPVGLNEPTKRAGVTQESFSLSVRYVSSSYPGPVSTVGGGKKVLISSFRASHVGRVIKLQPLLVGRAHSQAAIHREKRLARH